MTNAQKRVNCFSSIQKSSAPLGYPAEFSRRNRTLPQFRALLAKRVRAGGGRCSRTASAARFLPGRAFRPDKCGRKSCGKVLVDFVDRLFSDKAPDDFAAIEFRRPFEFKKLFADFRIEAVEFGIEHIKDQDPSGFEMKSCSLQRGDLVLHGVHVLQRTKWNDRQRILAIGTEIPDVSV